jgi:hypothetical protein
MREEAQVQPPLLAQQVQGFAGREGTHFILGGEAGQIQGLHAWFDLQAPETSNEQQSRDPGLFVPLLMIFMPLIC